MSGGLKKINLGGILPMSVSKNEARSLIANEPSSTHRLLWFGILPQILTFILLLIGIAYGISAWKVDAVNSYTVERKQIDLQDEGENKKLKIELALESAYGQVVDLLAEEEFAKDSKPQEKEWSLATQGRDQSIQRAWLVGEIVGEQPSTASHSAMVDSTRRF